MNVDSIKESLKTILLVVFVIGIAYLLLTAPTCVDECDADQGRYVDV